MDSPSKPVLVHHSPDSSQHSDSSPIKSQHAPPPDITGPMFPWRDVLSYMDSKEVVRVGLVNHDMLSYTMDESLWRQLTLKKLEIKDLVMVPFRPTETSWKGIYIHLSEGKHSYCYRQTQKHIDWMRVGGFIVESGRLIAADSVSSGLSFSSEENSSNPVNVPYCWDVHNVRRGLWIADLHLVRCPVCNVDTCEGTMQVLDARHIELLLQEGWRDGLWNYKLVGSHQIPYNCSQAAVSLFDKGKLSHPCVQDIFNTKTWGGAPGDWKPRGICRQHAVAACTNLQDNEGLQVKCETLEAGDGGPVVSVRVSQQLL